MHRRSQQKAGEICGLIVVQASRLHAMGGHQQSPGCAVLFVVQASRLHAMNEDCRQTADG
jgi:hypothetical protein